MKEEVENTTPSSQSNHIPSTFSPDDTEDSISDDELDKYEINCISQFLKLSQYHVKLEEYIRVIESNEISIEEKKKKIPDYLQHLLK